MASALVFNIQRYTTHHGPGVRTAVCLKGCTLRCPWCADPEARSPRRQLLYDRSQCTGCGWCAANCPRAAVEITDMGYQTNRELCSECVRCVCADGAKRITGQEFAAGQLLDILREDLPVFRRRGGGLTLTGGEPLLYPEFAEELLAGCRNEGIGTVLKTTGCGEVAVLERLLPLLDGVRISLKYADPRRHEKVLGSDNRNILDSIRRLGRWEGQVEVFIPLIPGWNDDEENLTASAAVLREAGIGQVTLRPFRPVGGGKHSQLDLPYRTDIRPPEPEQLAALPEFFRRLGLTAAVEA